MEIINETIYTSDGVGLEVEKYIPLNSKGIIYFNHGITVPKESPGNVLKDTAIALCAAGYKVITYDMRGHGKSGGLGTDITVEKSLSDFDVIFKSETDDLPIGMLGFSYGGAISILYSYLNKIKLKALVLYSPVWEFDESFINNKNSVFGMDIIEAKESGSLEKDGFVLIKKNKFKIGKEFINTAINYFPYKHVKDLNTKVLTLQAKNDVILSMDLSIKYGKDISDKFMILDAIHPLVEEKDKAILESVNWFNKYFD